MELVAFLSHRGAERFKPAVKPGLRGPDRNVEDVGDVGQRLVKEEVQDHDRSLVDGQAAELATDEVPLGHPTRHIGIHCRLSVGHHVQLDHGPALDRLRQPVTGANGEPVEPGVPRCGIAEGADVAPGQHERFLDRVLGTILIPKDEIGGAKQPGNRRSHQDGECVVVAGTRSFNELDLHCRHRCDATHVAAFTQYESGESPNGSRRCHCWFSRRHGHQAQRPVQLVKIASMDAETATALLGEAIETSRQMRSGEDASPLERFERRYPDMREAMNWFLEQGRLDEADRFGMALIRFWMATKRLQDGEDWFQRALGDPVPQEARRARAIYDHGYLVFWAGRYELADEREQFEGTLATLRAGLSPEELERTRTAGAALGRDEGVAFALASD